ncbi:MAG TPA: OmpA family protein, partial [Polyangiaceae bacterium]|nr:OmpA family protein [Polyangiaceae bacterium]
VSSLRDTEPGSPHRRYTADRDVEPTYSDRDKDGIPDDLDLCPDDPEDGKEPDPNDGCPAPSDRDGDGIPDDVDECPDEPEDFDGLADHDGCPEDDYDADGIPDVEDKCPREPGVASTNPELHGCPQFIRRIEGSTEIQILKRVEFATNSAVLLPQSFPILDEVYALLKANPDVTKVAVQGHTDNRGGRDLNMKLSQDRADSVMRYLVNKGVVASRLTATGYGFDKPIDTNDTAEGRQRNRRVEFHILEQNN